MSWTIMGALIILFGIFLPLLLYNAKKTKNKLYYATGGILCALGIAFMAASYGQYLLALIILCTASGISALLIPKMQQTMREEIIKSIEQTDTSGPLRLKDVFSSSFIPKLERTYGEHKAPAIYATIYAGFVIAIISPLLLMNIITLSTAIISVLVSSILIIQIYRNAKKATR
ncbi:MAG: hypothetical protein LBQ98_04510 [Nitrososphaerota archaeon]|nr:hypothetical protein [Nitrososphaerota archaeon]